MNEMNRTDVNEEKNERTGVGRTTCGVDHRSRSLHWWMPTLAVIGLVVAVVTGVKSAIRLRHAEQLPREAVNGSSALTGINTPVSAVSEADRRREVARIREARKVAAETFRTAVEAEHEAFKRRVAERATVFVVVRAGIPGTVDKYGFKKCWSVMYALAKDKVARKIGKGSTTNFDQLMNEDLRSGFYQPLQNARGEVLVLLGEFQARLRSCRDELDRNMAGIPDWDRTLGEPPMTLKAESLRIEEAMAALREVQIGATVAAAFDAACLVGVYQSVARLLTGAAARLAAGAIAGSATAMADSPAPGPADLIGLGIFGVGAAATAWEVRKAAKVVPDQLRKVMYETVDTQCAEVQSRTLDEGEKLYLSYVRKAAFASAGEN